MFILKGRRGNSIFMGTLKEVVSYYTFKNNLVWLRLQEASYKEKLKNPFFKAINEDLKTKKLPEHTQTSNKIEIVHNPLFDK